MKSSALSLGSSLPAAVLFVAALAGCSKHSDLTEPADTHVGGGSPKAVGDAMFRNAGTNVLRVDVYDENCAWLGTAYLDPGDAIIYDNPCDETFQDYTFRLSYSGDPGFAPDLSSTLAKRYIFDYTEDGTGLDGSVVIEATKEHVLVCSGPGPYIEWNGSAIELGIGGSVSTNLAVDLETIGYAVVVSGDPHC